MFDWELWQKPHYITISCDTIKFVKILSQTGADKIKNKIEWQKLRKVLKPKTNIKWESQNQVQGAVHLVKWPLGALESTLHKLKIQPL